MQSCPSCKSTLAPDFYFCPHCGKKIKDPPPPTAVSQQISLYLVSFFLPPVGIFKGIKYLKQPDSKSKTVGIVAIALTLFSLGVTVFSLLQVTNIMNKYNSLLNSQMNLPY